MYLLLIFYGHLNVEIVLNPKNPMLFSCNSIIYPRNRTTLVFIPMHMKSTPKTYCNSKGTLMSLLSSDCKAVQFFKPNL